MNSPTGLAKQAAPPDIRHADQLLLLHGESFVRAAYAAILGRPPDDDGLKAYVKNLRDGQDRQVLLLAMTQSPEAARRPGMRLPGLDELLEQYSRQRPGRFRRYVQRQLGQLLLPLHNRLGVMDDQLQRLEAKIREQDNSLQVLSTQHSAELDQIHGQGPAGFRVDGLRRGGVEQSELDRLGNHGKDLYMQLKDIQRRREALRAR